MTTRALAAGLLCLSVACSDDASSSGSGGQSDVGTGADSGGDAGALPDAGDHDATSDTGAGGDAASPGADTSPPPCPAGALCDDGDPCTSGDRCDGKGGCAGEPYTCDDGRPCTLGVCDGLGDCAFEIAPGTCLIANVCYEPGDPAPHNGCLECDPRTATSWTDAGARSCDDGDACTFGDYCDRGVCEGIAVQCDDGNPCTSDHCDSTLGCLFNPTLAECDDGDACTLGDYCSPQGQCVGAAALTCEDGNPCTASFCHPATGCNHPPIGAPCTDGDVCTVGDLCVDGDCVPGPLNACDDGNSCTDDFCDPLTGCSHVLNDNPCCVAGLNPCDDGNPCTLDLCGDGPDDCFYELIDAGPCSDGDPCTTGDTCVQGECVGQPVQCDDGNPCTTGECAGGQCAFTPGADGAPCDDGVECTTDESCQAGVCVAGDDSACQCVPSFAPWVSRVSALAIGDSGQPGQGVDVDGNPATCAPPTNCSGGIDNSLSVIAGFANEALADAIASGSLVLLFEHAGYAAGQAYDLNVFIGETAADGCGPTQAGCAFLVNPDALDEDCAPLVQVSDATISGGTLNAGGPGNNLTLPLPIAGLALEVTLYNVRLQAQVQQPGTPQATLTGVLGGAVLKSELKAAIEALPDDTFAPPLDKATILGFLDFLVAADIDTSGDGTPDAASIGLPFTAIGATIQGVAAP